MKAEIRNENESDFKAPSTKKTDTTAPLSSSRRSFDEEKIASMIRRERIVSALVIILLVPAILLISLSMNMQHYIVMSFIILAAVMLPFFVLFEARRPKARDVVLIAVMTAITAAANTICTHSFPVHAGTAMVVITGISLGPEAGFLTGALGRLICNIFDGQGPWTPWQMTSWGIEGFLAGLCFNRVDIKAGSIFDQTTQKKSTSLKIIAGPVIMIIGAELATYLVFIITGGGHSSSIREFFGIRTYLSGLIGLMLGLIVQHKKLPADSITMTAFTIVITFVIYGGIMNFSNMLMQNILDPENTAISLKTLRAVYFTGAPYDIQHALGAGACIFIFGEPMIKKLERVKIKFGIL
ncbi:MAG: ECF transporter S component [Lachnospiraceae bacterium]|jgi:energy-coupling factor transport system substrate-specific component|nr:ECF transporter S component [Lachnospiraceae bacterium]MEE3461192.1 ECF transporter S component [Lachnospiraceae bacterium]